MDSSKIKNKVSRKWLMSSSISLLVHVVIFFAAIFVAEVNWQKAKVNPVFSTVEFNEFTKVAELSEPEETIKPETNEHTEQSKLPKSLTFADITADTTTLDQLYVENTINVSIKYPKGWTFIDQNVKNKLDGVTFWANDGNYNPPPYIHLEVRNKNHFLENRFKHKVELEKSIAYFNEPEIMEEYVIQNVYLRTETDNDFSIKLMISGEEAFRTFQPRFFGMIKSLKFQSSILN